MKVVTAAEMREIDRYCRDEVGLPALLLMENAGLKVFWAGRQLLGNGVEGRRVVLFCGRGNNGGDGFAAARHFFVAGARVKVFLCGAREEVRGEALVNLRILDGLGVDVFQPGDAAFGEAAAFAAEADLVVDALLGTGFRGQPAGTVAEAIDWINRAAAGPTRVLAVDVPSGLDADTGGIRGACVRAHRTVTIGLPKPGLFLYPGAERAGEVVVGDISLPPQAVSHCGARTELLTAGTARAFLPRRPADAHKGSCGHVLVVAGSRGMTGAAALASLAGLRAGAGLVTLGVPASLNDVLETKVTEVMTVPLAETADGTLGRAAGEQIMSLVDRADAVLVGPGLSRHPEVRELVREMSVAVTKPLVIDADGLNALAGEVHILRQRRGPVVITPHPGEMACLLGITVTEVQADRLGTASRAAAAGGAIVVLKGAPTVISGVEGPVYINTSGNAGLATAGTGDVLAGMVAGLLAQGVMPLRAAAAAVFLHGLAADIATETMVPWALLAGDLLPALARAGGVLDGMEDGGPAII